LSCSGRAKNQRGGECGEGELGGWGFVKGKYRLFSI
jgi:hypothetical protein